MGVHFFLIQKRREREVLASFLFVLLLGLGLENRRRSKDIIVRILSLDMEETGVSDRTGSLFGK